MTGRHAKSPLDLLLHDLSGRPVGSRVVLALDPDRLVEWPRALSDQKGRTWEVVIYRGDDLVTRRAWQLAQTRSHPILFAVSRSHDDDATIEISHIADLLGLKGGEILDLSLLAYFRTLFPRVNPPEATLQQYSREFVENAQGFVRAYHKLLERWGEPDVWTRGQFLAILLLARHLDMSLSDVWCDDVEAVTFAAHAVWLICHPNIGSQDLRTVSDLIWEATSRFSQTDPALQWLDVTTQDMDVFRRELAAYLVVRDVLAQSELPHLDTLLHAKLEFTTVDPEDVGHIVLDLIATLRHEERWDAVASRATEFLTPSRIRRFAELADGNPELVSRIVRSPESPLPIVGHFVRQALIARFREAAPWPAWLEDLGDNQARRWPQAGTSLSPGDSSAVALLSAAAAFAHVEASTACSIPAFDRPEQLLDWYVSHRLYLLEYQLADALAMIQSVDDTDLQGPAYAFAMTPPSGLRYRVRSLLNLLDERLARFVGQDPMQFMYGPRSAVRIIPDLLRGPSQRPNQRVWILVMDGMRYDTWDAVMRPLLMDHFEVIGQQDRTYFSLLPSKTDVARRGLLASALGRDWKNFFQRPTKDERILVAKALGLKNHDFQSRLAFVTDAETTEAREHLRATADSRDINVLIYPISDDLGHYHNDTLAALNDKIRQQLLTQQGRRGIIDDLRHRVGPQDIVLVTSDHGFQELYTEEQVSISHLEARNAGGTEDDVLYRYLRFAPPKSLPSRSYVTTTWEERGYDGAKQVTQYALGVGGAWFQRERGRPCRFAHGGISLAEMCIPGVLLRPIQERTARIEFLDLPADIAVDEDQTTELTFELINVGNVEVSHVLTATTNLGEALLQEHNTTPPGKREVIHLALRGRCELDGDRQPIPERTTMAVTLKLDHHDLTGAMISPAYGRQVIRVHVRPRRMKIDTDALRAFDEL